MCSASEKRQTLVKELYRMVWHLLYVSIYQEVQGTLSEIDTRPLMVLEPQ